MNVGVGVDRMRAECPGGRSGVKSETVFSTLEYANKATYPT